MKRFFKGLVLVVSLVVLVGCSTTPVKQEQKQEQKQDWSQFQTGRIRLENSVNTSNGIDFIIQYENNTERTFNEIITIGVRVLDKERNVLNFNEGHFLAFKVGKIEPNFTDIMKVSVYLTNEEMKKAEGMVWSIKGE